MKRVKIFCTLALLLTSCQAQEEDALDLDDLVLSEEEKKQEESYQSPQEILK